MNEQPVTAPPVALQPVVSPLPCPFCGVKAAIVKAANGPRVYCNHDSWCLLNAQIVYDFQLTAWNRRDTELEMREWAVIGERWLKDSSLEQWFPFTAQKLKSLEAECGNAAAIIVRLNEQLEALRAERANDKSSATAGIKSSSTSERSNPPFAGAPC